MTISTYIHLLQRILVVNQGTTLSAFQLTRSTSVLSGLSFCLFTLIQSITTPAKRQEDKSSLSATELRREAGKCQQDYIHNWYNVAGYASTLRSLVSGPGWFWGEGKDC